MNVYEKAEALRLKVEKLLPVELSEKEFITVQQLLYTALKEQDRDTRHACAEALTNCETDVSEQCIWFDDAHAAIMNCRGGLE